MPRPRFTVRRLMIVVAVAGLVLGSVLFVRRCYRVREYAQGRIAELEINIELLRRGVHVYWLTHEWGTCEQTLNDAELMKREYEHIARYPWHGLSSGYELTK